MTPDDDSTSDTAPLYQRLLSDMNSGRLTSGTRLRVQAIAKQYGTSVNPVREVLRRMEGEGLVRFEKNKGAAITTLDRQAVINIFEFIALIEPYLVSGFAEVCDEATVDELENIHERLKTVPSIDRQKIGELDMEFHQKIVMNHHNERVSRAWLNQRQLLNTLTMRRSLTKGRLKDVMTEHDELIAAFRVNDRERATEVIIRHVRGAGQALSFHLDRT